MKTKKIFSFVLVLLLSNVLLYGCEGKKEQASVRQKIIVITTLFPLYDFAKNIKDENTEVTLLLPPGVEAHSFEPKPEDILKINNADIFIYTGKNMEPWVEKILKSVDNKKLIVIDTSSGINEYLHEQKSERHASHGNMDPHIWLDFDRAKKMVENILQGFVMAKPENAELYKKNAENYKKILTTLDEDYKKGLANCNNRYFFHAGHFAFGYLAKKYNLKYIAVYPGTSSDEEPTPKRIANIINEIKQNKISYIFYEEFISPRIAEVIQKETGAQLIKINPAHNVTKIEFEKGVTFIELMMNNLMKFKVGFQCQ